MSKLTEILVGVAAICVIFFAVVFIMDAKEAADREADRQEFAEIAESIGGSSRSTVTTRPSPYPDDIVADIYDSSDCEWLAGYADDVSLGPADPWDRLTELVVAAAEDRMRDIGC